MTFLCSLAIYSCTRTLATPAYKLTNVGFKSLLVFTYDQLSSQYSFFLAEAMNYEVGKLNVCERSTF